MEVFLAASFWITQAGLCDPAPGDDYSKAVSLFNAKDYSSAIPLFQKALKDDPGNAQAYYYLGSCQETAGDPRDEVLNYYISNKLSPDAGMKAYADKVREKLSPEDQDWVDKQFDTFSNPTPQSTAQPAVQTAAPPASSGQDYSQAVSLFDAKNYQAALPLFQQVVQDDPNNAKAFYYLGRCQDQVGYTRGAVLSFYTSDQLQPYPALKLYADKLKAKLSPEDQDWVEKHLRNPAAPALLAASASQAAVPNNSHFGIRFSTSLALFNLADFQSDLAYRQYEVQGFKNSDPTGGYNLQTGIPSLDAVLELNPYVSLPPNGELGISFRYWPATSYTYKITASAFPQYFVDSEFDLSSFEVLLQGRVYFSKKNSDKVRFYIEPGAGVQPIGLKRIYTYADTAGTPSSDQTGEDLSGLAFDGIFNLGAAFTLSPSTIFSLSGGYQVCSASGFSGTWSDTAVPGKNGARGSERLYTNPTTGQRYLLFVPDDPSLLSAFGEDENAITYSRPLSVDQSGFRFSMDLSVVF